MLNALLECLRRYRMVTAGDTVTCAVSGGADSMALLWGMYLLREKLGIRLAAAHFNHGLRGAESDRDEAFVRDFCQKYEIPFYCEGTQVQAGEKGLEAAAREARYGFLNTLSGKIATAHTANDNAETVLMHLVRGTGLKGLGAIAPINGKIIRPMLLVTKDQVMAFLQEYHIPFVTDSSNETDEFLRNRLRHHVMPLLVKENPKLAQNLSEMALNLREDEKRLSQISQQTLCVDSLRQMDASERARTLRAFLHEAGLAEPQRNHIALAEKLVFSDKPSAKANFGAVTICRNYAYLEKAQEEEKIAVTVLACPGVTELPGGVQVVCEIADTEEGFVFKPQGTLVARSRSTGDKIRLCGGTKSLKKLFVDKKIPQPRRESIPVIADDAGVVAVYGMGENLDRKEKSGIRLTFRTPM